MCKQQRAKETKGMFLLASGVWIWHNSRVRPANCADVVLRVSSGRVARLVNGAKDGL